MGMEFGLGNKREALLRVELARILAEIKKLHPAKVILFGSLNEHNTNRSSDIDIAIIRDTEKGFSARLDELYEKVRPNLAVDFFVYTPAELEKLRSSSYFVRRMLERGTVLYEA
jgi:predicted nucleotidyltransferase